VWAMHTSADLVSLEPREVRFRRGADDLVVRILEPNVARFALRDLPPPRRFLPTDPALLHAGPQADGGRVVAELPRRDDEEGARGQGPLIRRLQIDWPRKARRLVVLLRPDVGAEDDVALATRPLAQWGSGGPCRPLPVRASGGLADIPELALCA
jgi:hypothetical protein